MGIPLGASGSDGGFSGRFLGVSQLISDGVASSERRSPTVRPFSFLYRSILWLGTGLPRGRNDEGINISSAFLLTSLRTIALMSLPLVFFLNPHSASFVLYCVGLR